MTLETIPAPTLLIFIFSYFAAFFTGLLTGMHLVMTSSDGESSD